MVSSDLRGPPKRYAAELRFCRCSGSGRLMFRPKASQGVAQVSLN